jgi:hypothetical protein
MTLIIISITIPDDKVSKQIIIFLGCFFRSMLFSLCMVPHLKKD